MSTDNPPTAESNSNDANNVQKKLAVGLLALLLISAGAFLFATWNDTDPTPPPEAPTEQPEPEPTPEEPTTNDTDDSDTNNTNARIDPRNLQFDNTFTDGDVGWDVTYTGNETWNASAMNMYVSDGEPYGPYTWKELSTNNKDTIEPGDTIVVSAQTIPDESLDIPPEDNASVLATYQYAYMDNCTLLVSDGWGDEEKREELYDYSGC